MVARQHVPTRRWAGGKPPVLVQELEAHRPWCSSVLVTSDTDLTAEGVWRTHRPRAKEDNCIQELKEG